MLQVALVILAVGLSVRADGQTVWAGPDVIVSQPDDTSTPVVDVLVASVASLERGVAGPLCNVLNGDTCEGGGAGTSLNPTDFEFAFSGYANPVFSYGSAANYSSYTFDVFHGAAGGRPGEFFVGGPVAGVGHIISEDIYFDIEVTHWQNSGSGDPTTRRGFAYRRSSAPANPVPIGPLAPLATAAALLGLGVAALVKRRRAR